MVWPEVPAPFSLEDARLRAARRKRSRAIRGAISFWAWSIGSPAQNGLAPYNSAALLDPQGREEFLYDKIHLVPFSEYVPWRDFFWLAKYLTGLVGNFHTGTRYAVGELPGGRFGVFICYEAIFPDHVRQFVRNGATC